MILVMTLSPPNEMSFEEMSQRRHEVEESVAEDPPVTVALVDPGEEEIMGELETSEKDFQYLADLR
jgi:hypothetical protein